MTYEKNEILSPLYFAQPLSQEQLSSRLDLLVGRSIGELCALAKIEAPKNNIAAKGFAGHILELFLGAHAHNQSLPDFVNLGIELKSLPVSSNFKVQTPTFVSMATLSSSSFIPFEHSSLYHKVNKLLFVLLHAPKGMPIGKRRILGYFFYTPDKPTLEAMAADYNEFCELIFAARAREINASVGNILQILPKAAHGQVYTPIRDHQGNKAYIAPKAYYLRPSFTNTLLEQFVKEQGISTHMLESLKQLEHELMM